MELSYEEDLGEFPNRNYEKVLTEFGRLLP